MNEIKEIEKSQIKKEPDQFKVGDTVKVHFKIVEGKTERIQMYEGLVIAFKSKSSNQTFTVRKISYGVGVERIFPLHSPRFISSPARTKNGRAIMVTLSVPRIN